MSFLDSKIFPEKIALQPNAADNFFEAFEQTKQIKQGGTVLWLHLYESASLISLNHEYLQDNLKPLLSPHATKLNVLFGGHMAVLLAPDQSLIRILLILKEFKEKFPMIGIDMGIEKFKEDSSSVSTIYKARWNLQTLALD